MKRKVSSIAWRSSYVFVTSLLVAATVPAADPIMRDATTVPAAPVARAAEPSVATKAETPVIDAGAACEEGSTPTEVSAPELAPAAATPVSTTRAAACKPCKDRTWCKCTYNGMNRASCNPCCYVNDIGVFICLD